MRKRKCRPSRKTKQSAAKAAKIRRKKPSRAAKIPFDRDEDVVLPFPTDVFESPLQGTPKEVRKELDSLAMHLKKHPTDSVAFTKIELYMQKYLMGLVYHRYPYIRGSGEDDVYQEALLAITRKAIPKFNPNRGMSFLNFAKLCINRHLITMLHASKNRRKDMPINKAISLDHSPGPGGDEDDDCSLSNVITDDKHCEPPFKEMDQRESYERTLRTLKKKLSEFEIVVLEEYLYDRSYKDAAKNIARRIGHDCVEKSVDNALLRIRKKAAELIKEESGTDNLPLIGYKT